MVWKVFSSLLWVGDSDRFCWCWPMVYKGTNKDICWQCHQEAKGSVWFIGVRRCLSSHSLCSASCCRTGRAESPQDPTWSSCLGQMGAAPACSVCEVKCCLFTQQLWDFGFEVITPACGVGLGMVWSSLFSNLLCQAFGIKGGSSWSK